MSSFRERLRTTDGITLVETLVAMLLFSTLGGILTTVFISASKTQVRIGDEAQGLDDLRTVLERLGRDLRTSRGVETSATQSQLTLWLDSNSDYAEQCSSERITWRLVPQGDGTHFNVQRVAGDPASPTSSTVVGHTLVDQVAFTYGGATTPAIPVTGPTVCGSTYQISATSSVGVRMTYDAIAGISAPAKTAQFTIRLRNVQ